MTATFGEAAYDNAEDLMRWIESKTDMSATPPVIVDRFEYRVDGVEL